MASRRTRFTWYSKLSLLESSRTPPAHGGALPSPTTANGLNPLSDEAFVQDCHDCAADQTSLAALVVDADDNSFNSILYNNEHVLNRILPMKTESTYQLRPRRHNRSLTMKANATNECDFIVRMLSRTSINFTVSHFIIDIYFYHCFMCLYGCGLSTFIISDLIS